jgi:hypothetical protein
MSDHDIKTFHVKKCDAVSYMLTSQDTTRLWSVDGTVKTYLYVLCK